MVRSTRAFLYATSSCALLLATGAAHAAPADIAAPLVQYVPEGQIITPRSSQDTPATRGVEMHTNTRIFIPNGSHPGASSPSGKFETPASLACVYGVTAAAAGCNPKTLATVSTLGSKAIAIVDAYDYPHAMSDLNAYSAQYGLPAVTSSNFKVMYGSGSKPAVDSTGGWELEEALDIEMAHAMAPNATIILVEASSNSLTALLAAEKVAATAVAAAGGGEVSNSWGGGESSGEASNESSFTKAGVTFFASAGDANGTEFPSVLPNVIGVGGTTIGRKASGAYTKQTTWSSTGGGLSSFIGRPSFQDAVTKIVKTHRGAPDIGADANPSSGAWVFDTNPYQGSVLNWVVVGGTSEASPLSAAIVNAAGHFASSSTAELTTIYGGLGGSNFYDVTTGSCGNAASGSASVGYDLCTGVGAPKGLGGL